MNSNGRKDNKDEKSSLDDTATNVKGDLGAGVAFAGLLFLTLAWDSEQKMMKACGQDGYIPIKDFKDHPPKRLVQESA